MSLSILLNPVIISVFTLCGLCICRVNVLLAIIVSAIIAGLFSGLNIATIMDTFISGMGTNSETALSYILLGAFAASMNHTGLATILSKKIALLVKKKSYLLFIILISISILSQNLVPVHIAFIPILIPPLISVMNRLCIDRRAIACALAYGLKTPYIVIPAGFGLIFHNLIAENISLYGIKVEASEIWKATWFLGIAMTVGLLIAVFVSYKKPRRYKNIKKEENIVEDLTLKKEHYITLLAAVATLVVQLITNSLPLGAIIGLGIIFCSGTIKHSKMDKMIDEGIDLMGYIVFVMLAAGGFAAVLKTGGGIETFTNSMFAIIPESKFLIATLIMIVGLFITFGIGTSFGTIPILAVLFVPSCINSNFNLTEIIIILSAAAALGDAGSPTSDTTLGPTAGLNADGQHNHIKDTCIPTFLHFNIPLIIFALLAIIIF